MLIPVRCFSCNKEISSLYEKYLELIKTEFTECEALDKLSLHRICCRRMVLGHVDIVEKLLKFDTTQDINTDL